MMSPHQPDGAEDQKGVEVHVKLSGPSHFGDVAVKYRKQTPTVVGNDVDGIDADRCNDRYQQ